MIENQTILIRFVLDVSDSSMKVRVKVGRYPEEKIIDKAIRMVQMEIVRTFIVVPTKRKQG